MMNKEMSRRNVLTTAGAAVAASSLVATAAQAKTDHGHSNHMMGDVHKNQAVIDTAMDCLVKGSLCLDHCLELFKAKDTSVAECASQVTMMLPICNTLAKYAMADAVYLKQVARICIDVCSECEKECRKHENTHPQCKACAESCAACIKACKELIAA